MFLALKEKKSTSQYNGNITEVPMKESTRQVGNIRNDISIKTFKWRVSQSEMHKQQQQQSTCSLDYFCDPFNFISA